MNSSGPSNLNRLGQFGQSLRVQRWFSHWFLLFCGEHFCFSQVFSICLRKFMLIESRPLRRYCTTLGGSWEKRFVLLHVCPAQVAKRTGCRPAVTAVVRSRRLRDVTEENIITLKSHVEVTCLSLCINHQGETR